MATLTSVYAAFVDRITSVLTDEGVPAVVYAGWPEPSEFRESLLAHVSHVSVCRSGGSKPRLLPINNKALLSEPIITVVAAVSTIQLQGGDSSTKASSTATLTGTGGPGLNFLFKIGSAYVAYHPDNGLTLAQMATGAAAAINASTDLAGIAVATATGAVVRVEAAAVGAAANALEFWLRIGGTGHAATQIKSVEATIDVHVWSYDDPTRSLIFDLLDNTLAEDRFLTSVEDVPIRLLYSGDTTMDAEIRLGVYRRILHFTVQYGTMRSAEAYTVLEDAVTVEQQVGG